MQPPPPFELLTDAWQSGNPDAVVRLFHPSASWTIDGETLAGDEIAAAMHASMASWPHVKLHLRRAFCDLREPTWWAAEWVVRSSADGAAWGEIEQGLLLQLAPDGRIATLRTHNDHGTVRHVTEAVPLRAEVWPVHVPSRTHLLSREEILATHYRHTRQGWAIGSADNVVSCHAPESVIQTAFEVVRGHDNLRRSVKAYFENYRDTTIEVERVVYDGNFLAISQTWTCTNQKTGITVSDHDLNIGIMQDGKFYRWREYYDSRKSAQTVEQTVFGNKA